MPRVLLESNSLYTRGLNYDITPDGGRFAMMQSGVARFELRSF